MTSVVLKNKATAFQVTLGVLLRDSKVIVNICMTIESLAV